MSRKEWPGSNLRQVGMLLMEAGKQILPASEIQRNIVLPTTHWRTLRVLLKLLVAVS